MRSLRKKLAFSYALLIIITLVLSIWGMYHFIRLGRSVNTILVNNYKSILAAENMKEALERQDSAAMFFIAGQIDKARQQFASSAERFSREFQIAAKNITEPGEDRIVADINARYLMYKKELDHFLNSAVPLPAAELSRIYFDRFEPAFITLKNRLDDLLHINQKAMVSANDRAISESRRAEISTAALATLALIFALIFAWRFTAYIVDPISSLTEKAKQIAEGDFSQPIDIPSQDEIGVLAAEFNRMATRLRDLRKSDYWRILVEQKKSDAVIDSLYEPVIVTDARGQITKLNTAAAQLFSSQNGNKGEKDLSLSALGAGERILRAVQEAVAMQRPVAAEGDASLMPIKVGSTERSYRLITTPMRDSDGRLLGAVTVLEDLTALREVDKLKTEFISVASNKLRAPLNSLQMALHTLIAGYAGELSEKQFEMLYTARQEAEQLDELMTDLLELSEIESGTRRLSLEPLRPTELVRAAIERHLSLAECKHVKLDCNVSPDLPRAYADRQAVKRIFDNLLTNAIRHTGRDGRITISALDRETRVIFYVKDTGEGIAEDDLPTIFGRFVHAKGRSQGRTGLGLALVKRLVEAQGGQVGVESRVGEGTTFTFTLPIADPADRLKEENRA